MSERITAQCTTKNKSGFTFQGYTDADPDEISVEIEVEVPANLTEAAGEDFYGSEQAANKALQEDWKRRSVNAARPILRDAEVELDWGGVAQSAADSYKPGRKGGFQPRVSQDELVAAAGGEVDIDTLMKFLAAKGVRVA